MSKENLEQFTYNVADREGLQAKFREEIEAVSFIARNVPNLSLE